VYTTFQKSIDLHIFLDFEQYRLKATAKEGKKLKEMFTMLYNIRLRSHKTFKRPYYYVKNVNLVISRILSFQLADKIR